MASFRPACRDLGLVGVRFHDLRHTFASLMVHQGQKPFNVSRWMGHSSVAFTLDRYTHLFEDAESASRLSESLDAAYASAQTRGAVVPLTG